MPNRITGLALLISLVALGIAAWAATRPGQEPGESAARLDALDARLERVETALRERDGPDEPTLVGLSAGRGAGVSGTAPAVERSPGPVRSAPGLGGPETEEQGEAQEQIRELVDEAVEKKAAELRNMQDKKPTFGAFSETLGLSEAQQEIVSRGVVQAQHEIRAILDTPAADGTNFLDELVEVMAEGMARPGEKTGRGMKLFGRLLTEEVPGTSETYAARAEHAKDRLRETLRRELTPQQHALYEAWQMDPSEIREVENSPWKEIEGRVIERAKDLGADLPDDR